MLQYLLRKYADILSAYEVIGSRYVYTRKYWDLVKLVCFNKQRLKYVLDAGSGPCNQGYGVLNLCNTSLIACLDISNEVLKSGKVNYLGKLSKGLMEFIAGDLRKMPFRDEVFDSVVSIATLHHLEANDLLIALREIKRVTKSSGTVLISTWSPWQIRFILWLIISYICKVINPKIPARRVLVPWKIKRLKRKVLRYYVLYTLSEIRSFIKEVGLKEVISDIYTPFKRRFVKNNFVLAIKRED